MVLLVPGGGETRYGGDVWGMGELYAPSVYMNSSAVQRARIHDRAPDKEPAWEFKNESNAI